MPASATPLWRRGAAGTSRPSTHAHTHTHAHTSSPGRPRAAGGAGARAATTGIRTGAPESTPEIGCAGAHTVAPGDVPPAAELARAERSWRRSKGFRGRQLPGGQTAQIAGAAAFGGAAPLRSIAIHPSPSTHTGAAEAGAAEDGDGQINGPAEEDGTTGSSNEAGAARTSSRSTRVSPRGARGASKAAAVTGFTHHRDKLAPRSRPVRKLPSEVSEV